MNYALQPHLYRNVPVYYWPFLFWQLLRIALWVEASGHDVMLAVDTNGRVHVRHVSGDPSLWSPSPTPHLHQYNLTTRLPGERRDLWRMRLEAAYAPGPSVQQWIFWPNVLGVEGPAICPPERPTIRDPVALLLSHGCPRANARWATRGKQAPVSAARCA